MNTDFLHAEGGGSTRRRIHTTGHTHSPVGVSAASTPFPSTITKQDTIPLQNSGPGTGYPSGPTFNPPAWANPHFDSNSHSQSSHIGFNRNFYPTSHNDPPTHGIPPYPIPPIKPPYPISHDNPSPIGFKEKFLPTSHSSPTSQSNPILHNNLNSQNNPISHISPPHPVSSTHPFSPSPSHGNAYPSFPTTSQPAFPGQGPLFSSSFAHSNQIPIGTPYGMHPTGSTLGQTYYPQQGHMLSQPVAQPYIPGQTVVMVPGQQDSGRGLGQIFKEALVFSTVNAGVNRLLNPHQHYHASESAPSGGASGATTHITYNNHYYNNSTMPGADGATEAVSVPPSFLPGVASANSPTGQYNPFNPTGMTGSVPAMTGSANTETVPGNVISGTNIPGAGLSLPATGIQPNSSSPAGQTNTSNDAPVPTLQYKISDEQLYRISEELFKMRPTDISAKIKLNLQNRTAFTNGTSNITDIARGPLIYIEPELRDYPSIYIIRSLYDNYEHDSRKKENRTMEKRMEENLLIDTFLNTNTMSTAMQWLSDNGFIDPDEFERKDTLRHIWFTQFDGTTSGFERVFLSEIYAGTDILGVQNWLYFEYLENFNRIDYMGYVDKLDFSDDASLLKLNFKMNDIIRLNSTMFVGTLPELEMSLYTICFYARPNNLCPVSLGGTKFYIFTHSFRYFGVDLIHLGFPIF